MLWRRTQLFFQTRTTSTEPRPRAPFCHALEIETPCQTQRHSGFEWLCKHNRLRPEPFKFVRLDSGHAQSDGNSVDRGLPVLALATRYPRRWPKGLRSLGTRLRLALFAGTVCCVLIMNIIFVFAQLFQSDYLSFTSRKLYVCRETFLSFLHQSDRAHSTVNNYHFGIKLRCATSAVKIWPTFYKSNGYKTATTSQPR